MNQGRKYTAHRIGTIIQDVYLVTQIVFIILRVTKAIHWPWWAVSMPSIAYFILLILSFAAIGIMQTAIDTMEPPRRDK